jgi:two-component system nitrate/nitrite response regulator NarL
MTKNTPIQRLVEAVDSVLGGQVVVPQRLASEAAGARTPDEEAVELLAKQLTLREREVLVLLVEGASGQTIARRLGISPNTVRTHVQSILMKLQVHSRLQAATFAVRHRLVAVPGEVLSLIPSSSGHEVASRKALA